MQYGYEYAKSEKMKLDAAQEARALIRKTEEAGNEVVEKATVILKSVEVLLNNHSKKTRRSEPIDFQKTSGDIIRRENEISDVIRQYFAETSAILDRLGKLNPPLSSEELLPYKKAVMDARQKSIGQLRPVIHVIHRLQQVKLNLSIPTVPLRMPDRTQTI